MKQMHLLSEEKLISKGAQVIYKNLGPVEGQRFLSLCSRNRVESVRRHQLWQKNLDSQKFFKRVFEGA